MALRKFFVPDLEKLPLMGVALLLLSLVPASLLLYVFGQGDEMNIVPSTLKKNEKALRIDLPLRSDFASTSAADAEKQISFSVDPPRPSAKGSAQRVMVRLNASKQVKRVETPSRIDLEFSPTGALQFVSEKSLFWLEIDPNGKGSFEARLSYAEPETGKIHTSEWIVVPQDTPVQTAEEFAVDSPFRELAMARWWGQDYFNEKYGDGMTVQRLEIGPQASSELSDLHADQWLCFQGGRWIKAEEVSEELPIAHIRNVGTKGLELEGWEGSSHVRLLLQLAQQAPLKTKGDELFSQLRVRSEKQISCTLDKQCLILRPGDWVLKANQRWKILRRKEEKAAFLNSEVHGELFVLDKIDSKGASKSIFGHFFPATRTQVSAIDYAVPSSKGSRNANLSKAKGKTK